MQHEPSTLMVVYDPIFADGERLALAGFLAGYRGATRDAYALDLRQFVAWCTDRYLALFSVHRADIESYARSLEERGRARATVARRLCTVAGFYRYAEEEGLLAVLPGGACASAPTGLRVPRHRPGPQRSRRPVGGGRARTGHRVTGLMRRGTGSVIKQTGSPGVRRLTR